MEAEIKKYEQLVLPKQYRVNVLKLAHSIPLSGHLGIDKTTQRILRRFYWPTVFKDVASNAQNVNYVPNRNLGNHHLPIVGEPFERIAMDIVGPLPRSKSGHKYILVLCDYATKYPEAIPLRKFTAPAIAEQLIEIISRHGVLKEILTDQGSNFMSALLQELYQMLGVKSIRTTPYHPQTDGLVERFNQTLKQMLRKVIDREGRDWNKWVPYVLFAFREAPQASTGFSPFELVYGRDVRGPLDVLQEGWIGEQQDSQDDVLSYVQGVYDRLQESKEIVRQNMEKSQLQQKSWYDLKARETNLNVGDKVLVLLPTRTEKLLAKWK